LRVRFGDSARADRVTAIERWFNDGPRGTAVHGRLRALATGPDGAIYIGTSNLDGRGSRTFGDDRVLRLTPRR
jgi:quinoprotein glucose dehydrogenase